ncbi:NirD/YgiW/YdeI family stress tolerance protein [Phaeovibrio sulfidiphilus]|uniref:NirD/YgiW/YdeI family stress tolerance protein n=1 Tax=Phaeovibrio sulfidiphilus TaxID=1220600 RepID=A0A8J6YUD1_9PROT|nr:NirD/YgiW/YdeI family stress tolerance protein [Phaeovibrio sulfidiphilus]MBE1236569.1 NirD/YgiW/YdeI family stress tolerance protein [Phaeovibrio sulfidiphilus]
MTHTVARRTRPLAVLALGAALALPAVGAHAQNPADDLPIPTPALTTVKGTADMRDDTPVTLRGYLVKALGDEKYTFKDDTGTIVVEIDDDKWQGMTFNPNEMVELDGEIDRGMMKMKVDVDVIRKAQP